MIVNFAYPSSRHRAGGVVVLYEFANALARRGHEVHFIHGPKVEGRIDRVEDIPFRFHPAVQHHIVDLLDDPSLRSGDVLLGAGPPHLGQRAGFAQGFRLSGEMWDRETYRLPAPKICVASWLLEVGKAYGSPAEQLVHIPVGLDHEIFSVRTPQPDRTLDLALLYHPFYEKGWDVGLPVLEELARRRPGLRAVVISMAGAPPEPLPDGVEVVVRLGQRRLADEVYARTRVFVQASHHEGLGLTAIEAMACGAALVTTDCGGSRDYAVPGETACVVRAGDVTGLADCADALLDDDHRREALAAAGARFVRNLDWDRSGEQLEAFLLRYLADPASFQHPPGEDRSKEYAL